MTDAPPDEPRTPAEPRVETDLAAVAEPAGDLQAAADAAIAGLSAGLGPEQTALALAVLVNRAVTRLHALGRTEAAARKGQPEWPVWAQLQNASRSLVLQASTCRTLAARLAGRSR